MTFETQDLMPTDAGLTRAAAILRAGGLVAMPTETVYGLAGDARNGVAMARIFAAKARPTFNPLIAHVTGVEMAETLAIFDDRSRAVAAAFWPGALTLVLPLRADAGLSPLVTAGLETVAIRCPAHPVAQALLRAFGGPLAAPSANPSGRVSPTRADHVRQGLGGRIDAVLDGGPCAVGIESTILGLDGAPTLLRPGGVPVEALEAMLGPVGVGGDAHKPNAPGQLASHYAPEAGVRLGVTAPDEGEVWVGFGTDSKGAALSLSPGGDLVEAAAALFQTLRDADAMAGPGGRIAFAPVPETGLGRAINDRLRRAAAPRP
ncbi:L-threonylcarbamoyladenylate synthase [Pseudotabrizicola alkalilacus]|uniref:Threonylcarbamoyl-AMP synthase n=1 Tax=Pseudotabrizicola alkalilacus TaxID=2305252 RepID=A0A411Z522_9RHOB|nr:L-threonylcarbamoyladenylate synthase [Pseudotabrizicola alkalilacus]RGP38150.1 threonylcarbamoyl-AMP synthase [Pseudotabrizicola alkalilacus]